MKTQYFLTSLLATAMLFVVVDVSAMQREGSTDLVGSPVQSERSKRSRSPEHDVPAVKEEHDEQGNVVVAVVPGVLPGGENKESAIDVDEIVGDVKKLQGQLTAAKALATRRANEGKKNKKVLLAEIAALAKTIKGMEDRIKALEEAQAAPAQSSWVPVFWRNRNQPDRNQPAAK